jgi:hypothetical protein
MFTKKCKNKLYYALLMNFSETSTYNTTGLGDLNQVILITDLNP